MLNTKFKPLALPLFLLGFSLQTHAGVTSSQVKHITYQVPLNKSLLINLDQKVSKLSKGNPSIADILLFPPNQIFLRGKSLGTTNAIIWDKNKRVSMVLDVEVTHNLESLKQKLYELLPNEPIQVRSAQQSIVLSGEVSSIVKMDAALKLAQGYSIGSRSGGSSRGGGGSSSRGGGGGSSSRGGGSQNSRGNSNNGIINLMHVGGGHQVMLEVKIAELSRSLSRKLQLNTASAEATTESDGDFMWNALATGAGIFTGSYVAGQTLFSWSLDFSKNTELSTILAEPNLTTLSGKKASFLSGGEFPFSSGCSQGNCSVDFKQFGIGLEFIPVVLDANRINLSTTVSVSSLTNEANDITGGTDNTPSLSTREAQTTIELSDGQTMSIAGLLSNDSSINQQHTPGLSDLPLIGSLFRNRDTEGRKKELLILVTPHLARPIPKNKIRLPTDTYVEPDDMDFYVLGKTESRNVNLKNTKSGGINGQFGHQINKEGL